MPDGEQQRLWEEIVRIRERIHKLYSWTAALRMRADDFDQWRHRQEQQTETLEGLVERVDGKVEELIKTDEIAEQISQKLQARNRLELTVAQKLGAALGFLVTAAAAIKVLFFS